MTLFPKQNCLCTGDSVIGVAPCPVHGLARVRMILRDFVIHESDPCSFDHHGYCQEHGYFGEPGECHVRAGREALRINDA
jgi:hypothetical protein